MDDVAEVQRLLGHLTPDELQEVDKLITGGPLWMPLPGPQMLAYDSLADVTGFGGAAGGGKGLALTTPIATPDGWTTMGAVRVGDMVFDEAGSPCTVTAVSEVSHRPCYRLTFDDGSVLVADDVHRWVTFDAKELAALTRRDPEWRAARRAKRASRAKPTTSPARLAALAERNARCVTPCDPPTGTMRDTATLAATLLAGKRANHAIRNAGAIAAPDAHLPVAPYTLGAWLGDGSSRNGQFTGEDAYIWDRIGSEGYEVRHYAWNDQAHSIIGLKVALRDLGVLENKHIPLTYLRASYSQRLALLQGLMDTDGHAALDGGCEFDNVSEVLAQGVRQLAATLGIKSTLQRGTAKLNRRAVGPKWRVKFTTTLPVFGMPRKAERIKQTTRRTTGFRYLVACEPIDSVPTRCIAVDSTSRQYLAGDQLIPTHNTELAVGLILTAHYRTLFIRREKAQTEGVIQRLSEVLGHTDGYSSQKGAWQLPGKRLLEVGGLDNPGDENRWQGRPHDLIVLDEATEIRQHQARFVMGWNRTTRPNQRCRVLMTFNPPTTAEGRWVVEYFAPWLDPKHPRPAGPGELRWFAMVDGKETEVDGPNPTKAIRARSRTFIPSRITDNPFLTGTGYEAVLQSLPEPLRSQMLLGDFTAGIEDDPWQVIPTDWVKQAQARWRKPDKLADMDSIGVDVARGGRDQTIIARRHGMWFDEPLAYPGKDTPDGPTVAGLSIAAKRNEAVIHVDVIGVGAAPYDFLVEAGQQVIGVNVAEAARGTDKSGRIRFRNQRAELWWRMREALDPAANTGIALPPAPALLADLCAPTWSLSGATLQVASREQIIDRIGRSPDYGSAYVLALMDTPKQSAIMATRARRDYDPYA